MQRQIEYVNASAKTLYESLSHTTFLGERDGKKMSYVDKVVHLALFRLHELVLEAQKYHDMIIALHVEQLETAAEFEKAVRFYESKR